MAGRQKRFNNLSLYKKIVFIVSITVLCTYAVFFVSLQILTSRYEKELYQINAQVLNHVSSSIEAEMQAIEAISNNILGDNIIQENLSYLNEYPDSDRTAFSKRDIYQALYPYTFYDPYIKSINIVLHDGSNICMGSTSDIEAFDTVSLEKEASDADGRILWKPALEAGNSVVSARVIRQLKFLDLKELATLYIIVDIEQLIQDSLLNAGYFPETSGFIMVAEDKRIYPEAFYHDDFYLSLLKTMTQSNDSYHITDFEGNKEFIIAGSISYTKWDYLYFRDYDPLFYNIRSAKFRILVFSAFAIIVALVAVQIVFRHVLKHLDFLVEKIQCFGSGTPAPEDKRGYDYENRQDEIGQLHRSFDQMTKSVKVLRDENYDKQLLLRDATIKMLQQQINPHFLYNALDTINCMAQRHGADEISLMVCSLGNLFRASINGQDDLIPLSDELEVLENYIQIQRIRFKDRLNFMLDIPEDISHIYVPKLCIQPLVENAMKHAMEYSDEVCSIQVTIYEHEKDYRIKVANTGSQFEDDLLWKIEHKQITQQGSGVGLINIDSRMKLLYGDRYGLNFYNKDGMAVVTLLIPKERVN